MKLRSVLLNLLFPPKCVLCRRVISWDNNGLCQECENDIQGKHSQIRGTFCSRTVAALTYEGQVREAIHRLKFGDQPELADALGTILAERIGQDLAGTYDLISWIPVSEKRLKTRGYDQARLLCEGAAKRLSLEPVCTLKKIQDNPAQSNLQDPKLRKSNVKNVYEVTNENLIQGKRVLLIDDVITTGATMEEAARTLLRGGASHVVGATLARPPEKHTKEELL